MADPVSAAIASGVATKATGKILSYIESADDSEQAWVRSGVEVAIQAEAFYRQNIKDRKLYDQSRVKGEIQGYGELSQELAIRGDLRGFESHKVELLEDFGYTCASLIAPPLGGGEEFSRQFEEELLPQVKTIKRKFNC